MYIPTYPACSYVHICVHVFVCTCMHACMRACMDGCMDVRMYNCYVCTYVRMSVCSHVCIFAGLSACMYACLHVHTYVCSCRQWRQFLTCFCGFGVWRRLQAQLRVLRGVLETASWALKWVPTSAEPISAHKLVSRSVYMGHRSLVAPRYVSSRCSAGSKPQVRNSNAGSKAAAISSEEKQLASSEGSD